MRPALFLDRDGVVNEDPGYLYRIEDCRFVPGIFDLAGSAVRAGYALVIVTNQAGIGRGYYTESDFEHLTRWMAGHFADAGAPLTAVYFCPDHPQATVSRYRRESPDRKPAPGMLLRACQEHALDAGRSIIVGDKASDMEAGLRAGVRARLLFSRTPAPACAMATAVIDDLHQAIDYLAECPCLPHRT